jgi:hypothetical protein
MLKYIAAFALLFALAVYVSVQDKHPLQDPAQKEWNASRWYSFVRWPDGAATWAVLLTLLAIAEQNDKIWFFRNCLLFRQKWD